MTTVLALPLLYEAVSARFTAESTNAPCVFGWRASAQAPGYARRVVWEPGEDGDAGTLVGARSPGGNPRSLGTLHERFTLYIEAQDPAAAEDELAQYTAARLLFDAVHRAIYLAAHGTVALESLAWVTEKNVRRYGATLRAVYAIDAMIPDLPMTGAPVDTGAQITTTALDVPEVTRIAAPVECATVAPITLSGLQTIDSVALIAGDRVLVKDQAAGATNGLYSVAATAWTRTADADTSGEVPSGLLVWVQGGDINGGAEFVLTTPDPITLGTTALVFVRMTT